MVLFVKAQPYQRCLDGDTIRWSMLYDIWDAGPLSEEFCVFGDTIINKISYKKNDFPYNWLYIKEIQKYIERFFIRESEDASQLYILDIADNKEYLIFDLNLQIGDKFQFPEIWDKFWFSFYKYESRQRVESAYVDSIYIENGLKHIRFDCTFYSPAKSYRSLLAFIEGVGPNIGVFSLDGYDRAVSGIQIVNCFQNQSFSYKNELTSYPCGYQAPWVAIPTVFSHKDYIIQKEDNCIKVHSLTNENGQVSIYDISGRLHYSRNFSHGKEAIIPTASFPKGIYLLKIYSKDNSQINVHKIIL
jgi:hypothetical protein